MRRQQGTTMFELLAVMVVLGVLGAIAVPSASRVGSSVAGSQGARRLALVLRVAQADAQSNGSAVKVVVGSDGDYLVTRAGGEPVMAGRLCAAVSSTYPSQALEFTEKGWACVPGGTSPRAGHFTVSGGGHSGKVVVQLSGCVRCL
jgi:prepilin-type N-terminal cleavage/methylation domain-containing protein